MFARACVLACVLACAGYIMKDENIAVAIRCGTGQRFLHIKMLGVPEVKLS